MKRLISCIAALACALALAACDPTPVSPETKSPETDAPAAHESETLASESQESQETSAPESDDDLSNGIELPIIPVS